MNKVKKILIALLIAWNLVLTGFIVYQYLHQDNSQEESVSNTTINQTVSKFTSNVTDTVEKVEPSVVGISASGILSESSGSGVIIDSDDSGAYIVTNAHVIDQAGAINVQFANGQKLNAQLVGSDTLSDIALLLVPTNFDVQPISIGDSSLVNQGEFVVAIGSPLGLDFQGSSSFGIISGVNRYVGVDTNDDGIDDWDMLTLQTDAAINVGNSGGALVNLNGELIGITSMKLNSSITTSVEGMGFAIPVNEVMPIVNQLKTNGVVTRPSFGITVMQVSDLTIYQKSYLGISLDLNQGLLIMEVKDNSGASGAGIVAGDILVGIDDTTIENFKQYRSIIYSHNSGDVINATLIREGNSYSVDITLQ